MTSNVIFAYTTDQAIADGILQDASDLACPGNPAFPLGRLIITTNAREQLTADEAAAALSRHASGDWGKTCPEDAEANNEALAEGYRLLSVYESSAGDFWIITEADRSATTILMPDDY
ncbi:hypothetical protein [Tautonia rosea]|uniref:hypothetical protein n=1 Tax=Tautonia rosea TaxID=2728037 RepID=UPI0019D1F559|nr:hypothetical protein [Tautonia rosea]